MAVDVLDALQDELIQRGLPESAVIAAVESARRDWGGGQVYIKAIDRRTRDERIRRAIRSGANVDEAARQAGCSPATVRRRRSQWL